MAISMKNWKDRITQYPNRRKLINVSTGEETIVDVVRAEGNVTEAGDTFTASNMNDLEDRIEDAFDGLTAADISYSAGVSVADKLDSLTGSVNTINTHTASYTHASITQGTVSAYSVGKIYMVTGYMRANAQIASDTDVASVTGVTLANEIFASAVGSSGSTLRLMSHTDGRLKIEKTMPANEWFSFTMIGFLA
jgi:hypothetical protein